MKFLTLVANKPLSRLLRELMSILNCIIFHLWGKSFKSFSNDYFLFSLWDFYNFSTSEILSFWLRLFNWSAMVNYLNSHEFFIQFFELYFGTCPAMFFYFFGVIRRDGDVGFFFQYQQPSWPQIKTY